MYHLNLPQCLPVFSCSVAEHGTHASLLAPGPGDVTADWTTGGTLREWSGPSWGPS